MSKNGSGKKIKAVLFDLGKVILHFNFDQAFKKMSKHCALTPKDIEDYFVSSGLEVLYDGGKISSIEFYRQVKRSLKHSLTFGEFKNTWNRIFTPDKNIARLIRSLKKSGYRLVLISNTNAMHYEYIRAKHPIMKNFNRIVLSYKEKMRKPDERLYRIAARACGATPHEIFYIDDRSDLTEAASALGFCVFTYKKNPARLLRAMKKAGVSC